MAGSLCPKAALEVGERPDLQYTSDETCGAWHVQQPSAALVLYPGFRAATVDSRSWEVLIGLRPVGTLKDLCSVE